MQEAGQEVPRAIAVEQLGEKAGKLDKQHRHPPQGEPVQKKQDHKDQKDHGCRHKLPEDLGVAQKQLLQGEEFELVHVVVPELPAGHPGGLGEKALGGARRDDRHHDQKGGSGAAQEGQVVCQLLQRSAAGIAEHGEDEQDADPRADGGVAKVIGPHRRRAQHAAAKAHGPAAVEPVQTVPAAAAGGKKQKPGQQHRQEGPHHAHGGARNKENKNIPGDLPLVQQRGQRPDGHGQGLAAGGQPKQQPDGDAAGHGGDRVGDKQAGGEGVVQQQEREVGPQNPHAQIVGKVAVRHLAVQKAAQYVIGLKVPVNGYKVGQPDALCARRRANGQQDDHPHRPSDPANARRFQGHACPSSRATKARMPASTCSRSSR